MNVSSTCEDPERHQFACIESIHASSLHVASETQADIVYCKRKLLIGCNAGKAEGGHFGPVTRVRVELKEPRSFAAFQKALTPQLTSVTIDRKVNVVLPAVDQSIPWKSALFHSELVLK